jgi:hypothetical protein
MCAVLLLQALSALTERGRPMLCLLVYFSAVELMHGCCADLLLRCAVVLCCCAVLLLQARSALTERGRPVLLRLM